MKLQSDNGVKVANAPKQAGAPKAKYNPFEGMSLWKLIFAGVSLVVIFFVSYAQLFG